ncbi:MAG: zf-HC2 domain-containing protein [Armatimonadota bacterium]|nr:zf-HC2 domain-containing protein [Armatimonadota bacterium]MDR7444118.1 zf-HC2 domain-containing protein [Armatimonadota bacterium]MDR7569535.1 zf-HC2 domain-containing protein [Armatimonadota bacterium]MDR7613567.1 zf-HC2 domain-containing protein [Armatimonadota bacterium]
MRHPQDLLSAYVDGALSAEEATRLAAHLAVCASCREVVEDLLAVRALLRQVPQPHPRPGALAGTLRRLEGKASPAPRIRRLLPVLLAASALALLLYLPWPFVPPGIDRTTHLQHHARITLTHPLADAALNAFLAVPFPDLFPEEPWDR